MFVTVIWFFCLILSPALPKTKPKTSLNKYGKLASNPAFARLNLNTSLRNFGAAVNRKYNPQTLPKCSKVNAQKAGDWNIWHKGGINFLLSEFSLRFSDFSKKSFSSLVIHGWFVGESETTTNHKIDTNIVKKAGMQNPNCQLSFSMINPVMGNVTTVPRTPPPIKELTNLPFSSTGDQIAISEWIAG